MRILVLSGSPKGMLSATLQYVVFLQKKFPQHEFPILHVCLEYDKIEEDPATFENVLESVRAADGILWAYPIYTFLVHATLKRFIELINQREGYEAFRGKYAAALSTSIHFFDHTAHNYIQATCEDWGMNFTRAYSASVYDLVEKKEQQRLIQFMHDFEDAVAKRPPVAQVFDRVRQHKIEYAPLPPTNKAALQGKKVVLLIDSAGESANLLKMVTRFCQCFDEDVTTVDLSAMRIRSGCDGCFQCGAEGKCVFRNADDINDLYLAKLAPADIIVMAGTIVDRYLSWRWKLFYDRGFFLPVIPWWPGKQLGFLISGPLRQLANLREILEGYVEFHQGNLVGIVTDENEDSAQTDRLLDHLANELAKCAQNGYANPRTFLGIGGTRIFRDATWGFLRPVFQVAHRYYRKNGMYDFPQKSLKNWLLITVGMMFVNFPGVRKGFFKSLKAGVIAPLQKVIAKEK